MAIDDFTIDGLKPLIFDPGVECTEEEFHAYLAKFNKLHAIIRCCRLAMQSFLRSGDEPFDFSGAPIIEYNLEMLVLNVLKHSREETQELILQTQLDKAYRMMSYLLEIDMPNRTDNLEILTILSHRQSTMQESLVSSLARSIHIYKDLWQKTPEANSLDILRELEKTIGLPFEMLLHYGYLFLANAKRNNGTIVQWDQKVLSTVSHSYHLDLNQENQKCALDFFAGDLDQILNEKHLLNPFEKYPMLKIPASTDAPSDQTICMISPSAMLRKVSYGMFHFLSDCFNLGERRNDFRYKFGFVFEKYIGQLVKLYISKWQFYPEIVYADGKKSVDWFLVQDNKAILIEVKTSSIFLEARQTGSIEAIKADLDRTIAKGAKQLLRFKQILEEKTQPEFEQFYHISDFQCLLVVYDPIHTHNRIKELIRKNNPELSDFEFSISNIYDFERLLEEQLKVDSIFEFLQTKNSNEEYSSWDLERFLFEFYKNPAKDCSFLKSIYDRFLDFSSNEKG